MRSLLYISVIVVGLCVGVWWLTRQENRERPASDLGSNAELALKAQQALAATENLESEKAAGLWEYVQQARSQDVGIAHNVAVNQLLFYSQTVGRILDPAIDPSQAAELRRTLPDRFGSAETTISRLESLDSANEAAIWMKAKLRQQQARLLPEIVADRTRRDIAEMLLQAIAKTPSETFIGILLELSEEANLTELSPRIAGAVTTISDASPRNIVLAADAAVRQVEAASDQAKPLVARLRELSEPIAEELRQLGQPIAAIADKINQAIDAKEWDVAAGLLSGWSNVLRITSAYRTDYRRLNPHTLDFLLVAPVYQLAAMAEAETLAKFGVPPKFTATPIAVAQSSPRAFRTLLPVDMDLDGQSEWVTLAEDRLEVWKLEEKSWKLFAATKVAPDAKWILWADLFVVDSGSPDRKKASRAGLPAERQQELARVHDTYPNLVVAGPTGVQIFRSAPNEPNVDARLLPPTRETGLESVAGITALTRGDVDADGDLDLLFATGKGAEVWINRGNMTFYPVASHSQLPPAGSEIVSFAIGDLDRDLDIDFVSIEANGTVGWLENLLHQQFRWQPLKNFNLKSGSQVAIAELDGDVSWDIVAAGVEETALTTTVTPDSGLWRVAHTNSIASGGRGFRLVDFNNDSWTDLIQWDDQGVRLLAGKPPGELARDPLVLFESATTAVEVADIDNDQRLDFIALDAAGTPHLLQNMTQPSGHALAVRYLGIDDNATGRVNHYAIGSLVEVWFDTRYRAATIQDRTTYFGLGSCQQPTTMRAVLTNGTTQHVLQPQVDVVLNEKQDLKGSCPYLYAWDGSEFAFVTDCLWAAPLGLQTAPGKVVPDRPWEYLLVPGKHVAERSGEYQFRMTEELWEIAYLDQIELTAVDHPAGTEVYTNEKVGPPSIAEHKLYSFAQLQPLASCRDGSGQDVSDLLAKEDRRYVQGFDQRLRQGLTQPHRIECNVGAIKPGDRVVLVLNGWLLPTDTSLNIAIDQNPDLPAVEPPSVWVPEGDGWREAIPFMGFPGGKTKTIVVDLTEIIRPEDPRVQIRTSAQLYWDRAAVAINPEEVPVKTQPVALKAAELGWHGFSELLPRTSQESHRYRYAEAMQESKWPPLLGPFTQYGNVLDLLGQWDDAMVMMGPGDEIRLSFQVPPHAPPPGWVRDFVLHNVGWDKDADLNTLTGQTVGPFPNRMMKGYPFAESPSQLISNGQRSRLRREQHFRNFWRRQPATATDRQFIDTNHEGL
jgi:hypothetical protein